VIAFRAERLGLAGHARTLTAAVGDLGLPDYPPAAALDALALRLTRPAPDALTEAFEARTLVRMRAMRGAPVVIRPADYETFIAGVLPADESSMRTFIGPAMTSVRAAKSTALDAVRSASAVARRALAGGPLDRDQLHAELRRSLPKLLLPWCRACGSHHAHPSLVYAVALEARLVLFPQAAGPYKLARFDRWLPADRRTGRSTTKASLLQRFLRAYAPAKLSDFTAWAGISAAQARPAWDALAPKLRPIQIERAAQPAFVLERDLDALRHAHADEQSVRLIAPGDPMLQARDRDTLIPNKARQAVVWKNLSPRAVVLLGAEIAAIPKIQRRKTALHVDVQALRKLDASAQAKLEQEATRLAYAHGSSEVQIEWTRAAASARKRA
jgi:hypothetical protein